MEALAAVSQLVNFLAVAYCGFRYSLTKVSEYEKLLIAASTSKNL